MDVILGQSAPVIGLMVIGFLLRQGQIIRPDDRHVMTRLIISTTLPAVIFVSLARASIEPASLLILALCGAAIPLILHRLAMLLTRILKLKRGIAGVMIVSTLTTNIGFFLFPFFLAFYGKEGISRLAAFELGNSLVASSYAYYVATCYGDRHTCRLVTSLKRVPALPTLWANIFGVAVNLTSFSLPTLVVEVLEPLAAANTFLAMLTLGSFIELRFSNWKPMLVTGRITDRRGLAAGPGIGAGVWAYGAGAHGGEFRRGDANRRDRARIRLYGGVGCRFCCDNDFSLHLGGASCYSTVAERSLKSRSRSIIFIMEDLREDSESQYGSFGGQVGVCPT